MKEHVEQNTSYRFWT